MRRRAGLRTPTSTTPRSPNGGATWSGRDGVRRGAGSPVVPVGRPQVGRQRSRSRGTRTSSLPAAPTRSTTSSSTCCDVGPGGSRQSLGPQEQLDISVTHWAGQYVPQASWPAVCGPVGIRDPPVTDAEGKDCNVFHGDYTGLAVDSSRPGPCRLDRPEPARDVHAARSVHGRAARRLRAGRHVRASLTRAPAPFGERGNGAGQNGRPPPFATSFTPVSP